MDTTEIHAVVAGLVEEIVGTPADQVRAEQQLKADLKVDSLAMVEMVVALEDALGIRIADDEVKKLKTVGQLVEHLQAAHSART